jgi:hypothetical protein
MLKRLVAGGLGLGVFAWAGIAGVDSTTRDDAGQITVQGELGAFVTKIGDCINDLPNSKGEEKIGFSTVTGVPCDEPHHWQVIHKGEISLGEFSDEGVSREAGILCESALEKIFDSFDESDLDRLTRFENAYDTSFLPSPESWAEGDRTVDCLVGSDDETYTESFLG